MGIIVALLAHNGSLILDIIASKKGPVVELAKVVATNAKVISLLALSAKAAQRN